MRIKTDEGEKAVLRVLLEDRRRGRFLTEDVACRQTESMLERKWVQITS